MGIIEDNKKFKRTKTQNNPTSTNIDLDTNKEFDLNNKTIVEKKEKK